MDVKIMKMQPQHALAVTYRIPMSKMAETMGQAFGRIAAVLGAKGLRPSGAPFAAYPRMEPDSRGEWEVITGMPVSEEVHEHGAVSDYDLPGGVVAVTTHMGSYETLGQAYGSMTEWIRAHNMVPVGPMWESYLTDPNQESDQSKWRTDIFCPVAPLAA